MNLRKDTHKKYLADAAMLLVAAIWGGGFVAGKMSLRGFPPLAILMFRFVGSAILFGILFFPRIKKAKNKEWKYGCLIGTVQFLGLLLQLVGLKYTTPAKQSFLAASYVVFTPLATWVLLKVRPARKDGAAAVVSLVGIALISLNAAFCIETGDMLTLVFALAFSIQIVLINKYAKGKDILVLTFYQFAFSGMLSTLAVILTGTSLVCTARSGIYGVFYLVFINTALAIGLQNIAQRYTKSSHTALLLSLESVFGFLFSMIIYKEKVSFRMVCGCILVFAAIIISIREQGEFSEGKKEL